MNIKNPLKRIFTVVLWCLLGGSGLALLIAAINSKNSSLCQGLEVKINGGGKALFLNRKEVAVMLQNDGLQDFRNKKITSFDLLKMEAVLRKNNWIKDAQLYFDNNQVLKVRIEERQPVARIFCITGSSFLIDSNGVQLSLTDRNVFRLPVFTNYPAEKFGLHKDSALDHQIRNLAVFLNRDIFWSGQIQEINVNAPKNFLMTPLVGSQVIEFGDGTDFENKFHRLLVFYREVISQTGFEKYTGIKLAYAGQVIATRKEGVISRTDSIQARKNVMEMIRLAQKMETDTPKLRDAKPLEKNTVTEQNLRSYDFPDEDDSKTETNNKHQKQQ
jgi:cell division protein FtsQ